MDEAERLRWLQERIYQPKEKVRARKLTSGEMEIFNGTTVIKVSEDYFKANYNLAAQSLHQVKEHGQYEYHIS